MRLHRLATSITAPSTAFFLYGACALIAQLICLQELRIIFAGHELFLGFSLAAWMAWVGVGSRVASQWPACPATELWRGAGRPANRLRWALISAMPLLLINLTLIRLSKGLFGFGMLVGLLPMLLSTALLLAPVGLLVGSLFTLGAGYATARHPFSLGEAYLWETLGATVGGFVYSAWLLGRLSPDWMLVVLAFPLSILVGTLLTTSKAIRWLCAIVILAMATGVAASAWPTWVRRVQWRGYTVLDERLSRQSHLVLARLGGLTTLFEDGVLSAHFPDPAAHEALVHWPLLAHPSPQRVLVMGTASTGTLSEILKHPVAHVDLIELDPAVAQIVTPRLPSRDREALDDPRLRRLDGDGRRWAASTTDSYDVILLSLPQPLNASINRFYTVEAFRIFRQRLGPSGLLAFAVPSSENYLSPETRYFNASLHRTLRAVFSSVEIVAGDPLLFLASDQPASLTPSVLAQRYLQRNLRTREIVPSIMPIALDEERRAFLLNQLTTVPLTTLNRDFTPICYAYAWRAWLAKFVSPLYFLSLIVLLAVLGWALRLTWQRRRHLIQAPASLSLFALGCGGLVNETVLLLAFQAISGYVYWHLGTLFAAFMFGLALGSAAILPRLASLKTPSAHRWMRRLLGLAGVYGLTLAGTLHLLARAPSSAPWLVIFALLTLISGAWLGAAFPLATRLSPTASPVSEVAGTLYAADLWGAALGALVTGALLIPLVGLLPTVAVMGLVMLVVAWWLPSLSPP